MILIGVLSLLIQLLAWLWPTLRRKGPGDLTDAERAKLARVLGLCQKVAGEATRCGVQAEAIEDPKQGR